MDLNQPIQNLNQDLKPKGGQEFFKKPVFLVIVAIVVVAIICAFYFLGSYPKLSQTGTTTPVANFPVILERAPKGKVVADFPADLVIPKDAVITGSAENSTDNPQSRLLVTSYETSMNFTALEKAYRTYFGTNKWTIISNRVTEQQFSMMAYLEPFGAVTISASKKMSSKNNTVMILFYKQK
jgi:hypothetical protein